MDQTENRRVEWLKKMLWRPMMKVLLRETESARHRVGILGTFMESGEGEIVELGRNILCKLSH